jgi:hypothetical protein
MRIKLTIALLLFFLASKCQVIPFMGLIPTASSGSLTIQFRATTTSPATGVDHVMFGDPAISAVSYTDPTYSITVSSIATANWNAYSGCSCTSNDAVTGATGGSYVSGVGNSAYESIWFNYGPTTANFDATKPQFQITGLNTATTYTIKMTGQDGTLGFDANPMRFVVAGATTPSSQDVNGDVTSQSNGASFTLQPDGTGKIKVWLNSVSGSSELATICILKISW